MLKIKSKRPEQWDEFLSSCHDAASYDKCTHVFFKETYEGRPAGPWEYDSRKDMITCEETGQFEIVQKSQLVTWLSSGRVKMLTCNV